MKDYVKPCIGENKPDYVIIHVGINNLNSETTPEMITKLIADATRNIKKENCSVSISGIVPHNDALNYEALEVNQELLAVCKETKFDYIGHKDINPRTHLNKIEI